MNDVNKELVRLFFELNGFLVGKNSFLHVKRAVAARGSAGNFVLLTEHLDKVQQAVVDIKPWHTEIFFPSVISSTPELFRFVSKESLRESERFFDTKSFKKILVVSRLPNVKETLRKSIALLKESGIDHVIEFPTVLNFLVGYAKTNVDYEDNDLLQVIRVFKSYNLYKPAQLELFQKPRSSRGS